MGIKGKNPWTRGTRIEITLGAARGLEYLHYAAAPRILHRDVKSTNILLDDKYRAKITDLGMAKHLSTDDLSSAYSSPARMQGTFGYFAPEYAIVGRASLKSDVFSFGVVLLELISGRQPIHKSSDKGEECLVIWINREGEVFQSIFFRQNAPISGSKLGETAKRLVSSLHLSREQQMQSPPYYGAPAPHYTNGGGYHHGQGHARPMPHGPIHPSRTNGRHRPHTTQFVSGYGHPSASSPANSSYVRHNHGSSYPQTRPAATIHTNDLHHLRMHGGWFQPPAGSPIQNANMLQYPPRNAGVAQTPTTARVNVYHQRGGGYHPHGGCQQPYGASTGVLQQPRLVWVPVANQSSVVGRGYGHPQQSGNRFSGLGRGLSRRPPPPRPEHDS